jgi:3',5'-nucleoside bisphosphate phosphatase
MLNLFLADLHIHTVLSACAEVEMIPPLIIDRARRMGLSLIAIADHNTSENAEAVIQAAAGTGVHVLPGMEVQSREEVHLLCLFDGVDQCKRWECKVSGRLPGLANRPELFGYQFVVDARGDLVRTDKRFLAGAVDLGLEEIICEVRAAGGIVIPAHVDRPSFSILSNLGAIPEGLDVPALEVTRRFVPRVGLGKWPQLHKWPLIVNGDAHRLDEIENRTLFKIAAPGVREIDLALRGKQGRRAVVEWPDTD